jgi:SAM-dependent methyltransferase
MGDLLREVGTKEHVERMNQIYGELNLQVYEIVGHDFFGVISKEGIAFAGGKIGLSHDDHVLEIGSGIGGPARFFAKNYGCKVTGIDLSDTNYKSALKKTKEAGLEHLVRFVHGNALDAPFPDQSFSHVFGCDAWCYFPDKVQLYKTAYRLLRSGGTICFLEGVHEKPRRYLLERLIGRFYLESVPGYISKLTDAGFDSIEYFDVTDLGRKDVINYSYRLLSKKDQVESLLPGLYSSVIDANIEILGLYGEGQLNHYLFMARKN